MLSFQIDPAKIQATLLQQSLRKARLSCLLGVLIYPIWGFSSIDLLNKFDPRISLSWNVWPRIACVSLPFLVLWFVLRSEKMSTQSRLILWAFGFAILNTASASIHVWPLALRGYDILPFVTGVNNSAFVLPLILIAPPIYHLCLYIGAYMAVFYIPIFYIAQFSPDPVSRQLVLGDSIMSVIIALFLGVASSRASRLFVIAQLKQEALSEKFLHDRVTQVISEGRWEDKKTNAFILALDIRGYTNLLREYADDLPALRPFIHDIHILIHNIVREKFKGTVHKTAGDGFLAFFGMFDDDKDQIENLVIDQHDQSIIQETMNRQRFQHATRAVEEVFFEFEKIKIRHGMDQNLRFCAALDYGSSLVTILGDQRNELDVISLHIAKASRLEAYSKILMREFGEGSYLVVSEDAMKFSSIQNDFRSVETNNTGVLRSFNETRRVYFKKAEKIDDSMISEKAA